MAELRSNQRRSRSLNDHVDIYVKDDMLYNIRSYTGDLDYIIRFAKTDDGYLICDLVQNCDPDGDILEPDKPTDREHALAYHQRVVAGFALGWIDQLCGGGRFEREGEGDDLAKWVWHDPRQIVSKVEQDSEDDVDWGIN